MCVNQIKKYQKEKTLTNDLTKTQNKFALKK